MSEYYGTPAGVAGDPPGYGHATEQHAGWHGGQYPGAGSKYSSGPSASSARPGVAAAPANPALAQPDGAAAPANPALAQPGVAAGQPGAAPAQSGAAAVQQGVAPAQSGAAPAQPHVSLAQPGAVPARPGYPTGRPGLLDTSFIVSTTQQTARVAYVAVVCLCAVLALVGLFRTIGHFAAIQYSGITAILGGLSSLLLYGALAFAVLTVGRLVIDYFVQEDRKRG